MSSLWRMRRGVCISIFSSTGYRACAFNTGANLCLLLAGKSAGWQIGPPPGVLDSGRSVGAFHPILHDPRLSSAIVFGTPVRYSALRRYSPLCTTTITLWLGDSDLGDIISLKFYLLSIFRWIVGLDLSFESILWWFELVGARCGLGIPEGSMGSLFAHCPPPFCWDIGLLGRKSCGSLWDSAGLYRPRSSGSLILIRP